MASDHTRLADRHDFLRRALGDARLTRADLHVLGQIEAHANHKRSFAAWPSVEKLSENSSFSRRTVLRAIANLEQWGYVEVQKRGRSNMYLLLLDGSKQVTSVSPIEEEASLPDPLEIDVPEAASMLGAPVPDAQQVTNGSSNRCHSTTRKGDSSVTQNSLKELTSLTHLLRASRAEESVRLQGEETRETQRVEQEAQQERITARARAAYEEALSNGNQEAMAIIEKSHRTRIKDLIPHWR